MKIELKEIPIQEVVKYSLHLAECQGYADKGEDGVYGMSGRLNIRPQYQREFIYKDAQRDAVINTIRKNFPLNVLYWVRNSDGSYEVLDGQQRLISIGQYISGDFSIKDMFFHNLTEDQQKQILDYRLMVYFCEGTDSEKLDWFRTINIAGEKLSNQELRNAIYSGPWVSDAKKYFSRNGCGAHEYCRYLKGKMNRQDYLETAIKWISNGSIEAYMSEHQHDVSAKGLWEYFSGVIEWAESIFTTYRKQMKGVPFGDLYNKYGNDKYDPDEIEIRVSELMEDNEVTRRAGIYIYIFTGDEKHLSIRTFDDNDKSAVYEEQGGVCPHCNKKYDIEEMEGDHIKPWSLGGKTTRDNCQMLCKRCNLKKGAINEQKIPERQMVRSVRA